MARYFEDISDLRAEAANDALGELYAGRDEWEPDERPTRAELEADDFDWERERWRGWTSN